MKKNIGTADRIIRLIIAVILLYLYFSSIVTGTIGIILLVFAIVLIATSIAGFCGLYSVFGVNTCRVEKR